MSTRLIVLFLFSALLFGSKSFAQIDLNNLDLKDLIGKVVHVQKGFAPKFSLGKTPIEKIAKVQEILGLKQNEEVNRLFKTFKTGRTIYKVAAYAGGAIAVYSLASKLDNSVKSNDYNGALYSGISAIGTGLIIKFLTKGASYKAVDIFNGIAVKKIRDIFSIGPASNNMGVGLYVKL
ncbi:hypothetical protein EFY79_09285 [Hanamia caeni]|jgi:hypothetical protein|uniref:Uncharacterized protein n=1 Tax=Hanamia caeni TaxID=2294116 RepID=A0A3M9NGS8_9BACT|nr:hypothetical protein [Hanamia caeni]RNI36941.1 hypothetical protein EFY79_09285 [Hanamia caeni]